MAVEFLPPLDGAMVVKPKNGKHIGDLVLGDCVTPIRDSSQLVIRLEQAAPSKKSTAVETSQAQVTIDFDDFVRGFGYAGNYQEKPNHQTITSARDRHVTLIPETDIFRLSQYAGLEKWFDDNVTNFCLYKDRWPARIVPKRLLYLLGPRGMGRATMINYLCAKNQVNFFFVRSCSSNPNYIYNTIKKFGALQPCVIYFDDAIYLANEITHTASIFTALMSLFNMRTDNVWIIMSGETKPPFAPMFKHMLDKFGEVLLVPCLTEKNQIERLIMTMFHTISNSDDYPCTMADRFDHSHPWTSVLTRLAQYATYCTVREVNDFIVGVFRRFIQAEAAATHGTTSISVRPRIADFEEAFKNLFRQSASDTSPKTLAGERHVFEDHKEMQGAWQLYQATTCPAASLPASSVVVYSATTPPIYSPVSPAYEEITPRSIEAERAAARAYRQNLRLAAEDAPQISNFSAINPLLLPQSSAPPGAAPSYTQPPPVTTPRPAPPLPVSSSYASPPVVSPCAMPPSVNNNNCLTSPSPVRISDSPPPPALRPIDAPHRSTSPLTIPYETPSPEADNNRDNPPMASKKPPIPEAIMNSIRKPHPPPPRPAETNTAKRPAPRDMWNNTKRPRGQ